MSTKEKVKVGQEVVVLSRFGKFSFGQVSKVTPTGQFTVLFPTGSTRRYGNNLREIGTTYSPSVVSLDVESAKKQVADTQAKDTAVRAVMLVREVPLMEARWQTKESLTSAVAEMENRLAYAKALIAGLEG